MRQLSPVGSRPRRFRTADRARDSRADILNDTLSPLVLEEDDTGGGGSSESSSGRDPPAGAGAGSGAGGEADAVGVVG